MVYLQVKWSRNNIAATMERFEPQLSSSSSSSHNQPQELRRPHDYSYAYYDGGDQAQQYASNSPLLDVAGPSQPPPRNSMRALMSTTHRNGGLIVPGSRHMYTTRYGTQENIYEEIGAEERIRILTGGQSMVSLNQSMVEEEFRRVQNRHRRVLGELNLSVEAMLMPTTPPSDSPNEDEEEDDRRHTSVSELTGGGGGEATDELLSPVSSAHVNNGVGDMDSGFSGSSSGASYVGSSVRYRNGVGSTRSQTPNGVSSGLMYGSGSARSSQRSHEDPGVFCRSSFGSGASTKGKPKSAEDPGPISILETVKKTSFWSRKGWRKLPGFSSSTSVHKAGLLNGE